ncbi:hypothetical protein BJ878DRAFT_513741 [Calycina marina]|uniref:Uncharacterized protein n=1 Tax=Calycina marina TaxID=1763456 RepID=A0A9P7YZQ1_9HELO|nr:hypothetical protein BJ878DRAFT_513741 [Calycina marina]
MYVIREYPMSISCRRLWLKHITLLMVSITGIPLGYSSLTNSGWHESLSGSWFEHVFQKLKLVACCIPTMYFFQFTFTGVSYYGKPC